MLHEEDTNYLVSVFMWTSITLCLFMIISKQRPISALEPEQNIKEGAKLVILFYPWCWLHNLLSSGLCQGRNQRHQQLKLTVTEASNFC